MTRKKIHLIENINTKPEFLGPTTKYLPTGSTMLNLLLTNTAFGGYPSGRMINLIGDSFAGKTFLLWTLFAELFYSKIYSEYDLYYDEPELDFEIDAEGLFGKGILEKVIWEEKNKIIPGIKIKKSKDSKTLPAHIFHSSETIEDMGRQALKILSLGKPCVYSVDSLDNLVSEKEKQDEDSGYIAAKRVRVFNDRFRKLIPFMKDTKALLFLISQVRTNLDATFGSKKTRNLGKALKHWAAQEIWLANAKPITKTIRGKKIITGGQVIARVTKNKVTGRKGSVMFPLDIYYGIDDTTSIIDWMLEYKFWKKSKASIKTPFGTMSKKKLIYYIEEKEKRIFKLKLEVQGAWNSLIDEIKKADANRKKRYS
jgi:RecA/RadA recombinase